MKIGFIGQGWIGKNYADSFEAKGLEVVRYSIEASYLENKKKISECDIVFIAVPTPTTVSGFDDSIIREVIALVGKGKTAVIKSTMLPGTTDSIQEQYPEVFVLHSPEFLTEATARFDADHPTRNIIGIPKNNTEYKKRAEEVMKILPKAPYEKICAAREAEVIKYGRNVLGYVRVVFSNILYDIAQKTGADWKAIEEAISADPDNGPTYMKPLHKSGRGAGGDCFIKDFSAFADFVAKQMPDDENARAVLEAVKEKNLELLVSTNKDLKLLEGVYGSDIINKYKK